MGIIQALYSANSGLTATQSGLELVARNIANAETPGYTRKTQELVSENLGGIGGGVRELDPNREVDEYLQSQVRESTALLAATEVKQQFLDRVDAFMGIPGEVNALDTLINNFSSSLQSLVTAPEDSIRREEVIGDATVLAAQLTSVSNNIQDLRQLAEDSINEAVDEINDSLEQLNKVNQLFDAAGDRRDVTLLDERDKFLDRLGQFLEISIQEEQSGRVSIFTKNGTTLLAGSPTTLDFDQKGEVNAYALYSSDPTERSVGTIFVRNSAGFSIDLIATGSIQSGYVGALIELRDETLVEVQNQLDELAHHLALTFSNKAITSTTATSGTQTGLDVDLTGILAGNEITLTYTDTTGPTQNTVTIIRVDDATKLPLSNDVTANPNDTVIGVDFSGGIAAAAATINTALGANLTVSNPSGNILRILDDGVAGLTDVDALSATISATAVQDDGLQLPIFTDGQSLDLAYSGSLDNLGQKLGFSSRISVNSAIRNNDELLIRYASSPETAIGDPDRPQEIYNRLANTIFTVHPASGIGQTNNPTSMTLTNFTQKVITTVTSKAEFARQENASQEVITTSLQERFDESVSVDIDQELTNLITLQNAFAANARVIQTVQSMMQLLLEL